MRFHMLGVAYIRTLKKHSYCAFTHRCIRLCRMLRDILGHEVIYYGVEGSEVSCDEMVPIISNDDYERVYGHIDPIHQQIPLDMESDTYKAAMAKASEEVGKRKRPGDFLLAMVGYYHKPA